MSRRVVAVCPHLHVKTRIGLSAAVRSNKSVDSNFFRNGYRQANTSRLDYK